MPRISAAAKIAVRRNLLETAAAHFARHGLAAASVDAISLDAGYAKGTLYNYFRSKDELFEAVIEEAASRAVLLGRNARRTGSVRRRLLALAEADLSMLSDHEAFAQVLVRESLSFDAHFSVLVASHLSPLFDAIASIIGQGMATGEIRADRSAAELARLFRGNQALLYVQHWASGGTSPALGRIPGLAVDSFLQGAMTRTADRDEHDANRALRERYQLSLFPRILNDGALLVEASRRSPHDQDGQPAWN